MKPASACRTVARLTPYSAISSGSGATWPPGRSVAAPDPVPQLGLDLAIEGQSRRATGLIP